MQIWYDVYFVTSVVYSYVLDVMMLSSLLTAELVSWLWNVWIIKSAFRAVLIWMQYVFIIHTWNSNMHVSAGSTETDVSYITVLFIISLCLT